MHKTQSILLLAPQLYGDPGGIQAYMRRLWEILSAYEEHRGCSVQCLSLTDQREESERHPRLVKHDGFFGCQGKKLTFLVEALRLTWAYPDSLLVVGHIRQAPVAWVLKRVGLIQSFIVVIYGIDAWTRLPWLQRRAARNAASMVSITRYTAQEFCKHNDVDLERFWIIPPTLADDEIDPPVKASKNNSGEMSVLAVGRLSTDDRPKGIDILIEAVAKARNTGAQINLTIVGKGNDVPRLTGMAERLGLNGQVRFLGAVTDDSLLKLYQECDVFAMPSKKEGFGIVFLEAMRFQKPCIGGNHAGTPEVVDHGVDGYLVNYGDVDQLAGCLFELSRNSQLRQDMGMKGYQKIKSNYLFPHMADKWVSLLDKYLGP